MIECLLNIHKALCSVPSIRHPPPPKKNPENKYVLQSNYSLWFPYLYGLPPTLSLHGQDLIHPLLHLTFLIHARAGAGHMQVLLCFLTVDYFPQICVFTLGHQLVVLAWEVMEPSGTVNRLQSLSESLGKPRRWHLLLILFHQLLNKLCLELLPPQTAVPQTCPVTIPSLSNRHCLLKHKPKLILPLLSCFRHSDEKGS